VPYTSMRRRVSGGTASLDRAPLTKLQLLGAFPLVVAVCSVIAFGLGAPSVAHAAGPHAARVGAEPHPPAGMSKPAVPAAAHTKAPSRRLFQCTTPSMSGDWRNIDANTRSVTRVVVDFACSDVVLCDTDGHCSGGDTGYSIHPFGKCHPTDCDWGRLKATDMGNGWQRAIFNFGFAADHVWIKTYQFSGLTYLRVWVYTDFTPSDGRTDYVTDEWFLR